jgi:hypothetical protein
MPLDSLSILSAESARPPRRILSRERLIASLVLLLLACALGFLALRKFEALVTFHPAHYSPGESWRIPANAEEVWLKTSDNVRLNAWLVRASAQPSLATIIYFHGNGGNISNLEWTGRELASRGFDVLLLDYRGYGRSDGETDGERELNLDGEAAYDYIVRVRGVSPARVVLFGQSLGTTVAADLASRKPCGALLMESGLSSAADMAAQVLYWLPRPLYSLGKNRFESAHKLARVHAPVLIVHGEPDPVIPTEQGRKLYAAANQPKRLLIYPGAGHNVQGIERERYLDEVSDFIRHAVSEN